MYAQDVAGRLVVVEALSDTAQAEPCQMDAAFRFVEHMSRIQLRHTGKMVLPPPLDIVSQALSTLPSRGAAGRASTVVLPDAMITKEHLESQQSILPPGIYITKDANLLHIYALVHTICSGWLVNSSRTTLVHLTHFGIGASRPATRLPPPPPPMTLPVPLCPILKSRVGGSSVLVRHPLPLSSPSSSSTRTLMDELKQRLEDRRRRIDDTTTITD